ncbi:cytochrome P450 [Novosphingobium sp. BL-52-GroH]|uniref:cytochrome P450 n=1 Tax=Novosphingobium sp. BL-52-GroH TaxID=3349877 RepID=UPI003851417B
MNSPKTFPSYEVARCPYPFYEQMRGCPVAPAGVGGEFIVSAFDDVSFVLTNPQIFSSASTYPENGRHRTRTVQEARGATSGGFVMLDPPVQAKRRRVARQILKADDINSLKPLIESTIDELIDEIEARGSCEFINDFAERLPARVVLTMLGLPMEDQDRAIGWARYDGRGTRFHPSERQDAIQGTLLDVAEYMKSAIVERYETPRDDGLSRFIKEHVAAEGEFNLVNVLSDASLLMFGGVTTTAHMLGNTMKIILDDPALHARVMSDAASIPLILNEGLRLESPVQWVDRLCMEDVEVGGVHIPAGAIVIVLLGSANRDEAVFERPDTFAFQRRQPHVAFGKGIHTCIGAPLALAEGKLALEKIFRRLPNIRYDDARNNFDTIGDTMLFRGLDALYLTVT